MKRLITILAAVLCSTVLFAQEYTGGVTGTVVNRNGRQPVENARLVLMQGATEITSTQTEIDGTFQILDLPTL